MKKCSACGTEKSLSEFAKNRIKKDGHCAACKTCRNARKKNHYYKNRESEIAAARAWNLANPEAVKVSKKASYDRHKERLLAESREKYLQRRDEITAQNTKWRKANPAKCAVIKARRRAAKLQRTPPWLTDAQKAEISALYAYAAEMREAIGEEMHVDHIVPLQGADVCGLHVPWNLQVLRGADNNEKYNKIPDCLRGWRRPDGTEINS